MRIGLNTESGVLIGTITVTTRVSDIDRDVFGPASIRELLHLARLVPSDRAEVTLQLADGVSTLLNVGTGSDDARLEDPAGSVPVPAFIARANALSLDSASRIYQSTTGERQHDLKYISR